MLISNLFLLFCIFSLPVFFYLYPPKAINSFYGYRTKKSVKNKENWDFANRTFTNYLLKFSLLLVIIQILIWFLLGGVYSVMISSFIWVIILILSVYLTEKKMKNF